MMNVKLNKGASAPLSTGLGRINVDEKEAAAASIEGWQMLVSGGSQFFLPDGRIANRVKHGDFITAKGGSNLAQPGIIPGTAFSAIQTTPSGVQESYSTTFGVNATAHTFLAVIYLPGGNGPDQLITPTNDPEDGSGDRAPRWGFNTSGAHRLWVGNTQDGLLVSHSAGDPDYYDQLVYIMGSFSTTNGATLRRNGALAINNPAQTAPLVETEIDVFGYDFNGYIAELGILSIDLAAPENAGSLAVVDEWLMTKYGL